MMHVTSETPSKSSCLAEVYAEHYRWLCFALQSDLIFFFFLEKLLVFYLNYLLSQMKIMSRLVLVITVAMLLD